MIIEPFDKIRNKSNFYKTSINLLYCIIYLIQIQFVVTKTWFIKTFKKSGQKNETNYNDENKFKIIFDKIGLSFFEKIFDFLLNIKLLNQPLVHKTESKNSDYDYSSCSSTIFNDENSKLSFEDDEDCSTEKEDLKSREINKTRLESSSDDNDSLVEFQKYSKEIISKKVKLIVKKAKNTDKKQKNLKNTYLNESLMKG